MTAPPYRVAIVGCTARKRLHACRAREMYTGQYFEACMAAARVVGEQVFILSAKHGLLRPQQRIEPYDMTWRHPDAVSVDYIREQACVYRIRAARVTVLCGSAYADRITAAWPDGCVETPLAHLNIGQQLHRLAELARG